MLSAFGVDHGDISKAKKKKSYTGAKLGAATGAAVAGTTGAGLHGFTHELNSAMRSEGGPMPRGAALRDSAKLHGRMAAITIPAAATVVGASALAGHGIQRGAQRLKRGSGQ